MGVVGIKKPMKNAFLLTSIWRMSTALNISINKGVRSILQKNLSYGLNNY